LSEIDVIIVGRILIIGVSDAVSLSTIDLRSAIGWERPESQRSLGEYGWEFNGPREWMPFANVHEASIIPILEPYAMVLGRKACAILVDPDANGLLPDGNVCWVVEAIALLIPEFTSWAVLEYYAIPGYLPMGATILLEALASRFVGLGKPILLSDHILELCQ